MPTTNWNLIVRFQEHKSRVENLIQLYESHPDSKGKGRKDTDSTDILRAAVVLLHATFEDMCRAVERHMAPYASKEAVNAIPLKGTGERGQPSKFFLGELVAFRGKKVDDVIAESLREYLARTTYNSPDDLCAILKRYGLNKKHFQPYLANLGSLNNRRHAIVHQADRNEKKGRGQHQFTSIGKTTVKTWLKAIEGVYNAFNKSTKEI